MAKKNKRSAGMRGKMGAIASSAPEFNPDYSHVKSDLARIGILAGSFFAILIILSFFLR
ncbi:MAG TPA: hypothetical protein VIV15_04000 [Anaerolineales bacterium]